MKHNKLLLLGSSLGTLALLAWAAAEEHFLADWRQRQAEYQMLLPASQAAAFAVQLRQVVVPALRVTDRCTSCHLGMAPGETPIAGHSVFGPHPSIPHDPSEYGCTTCHGGQGRATSEADAHGEVHFWPEPMIPVHYADAGCGSCHTHLAVPDARHLAQGELLFERYDCLSCHSVQDRGGTLRPFQLSGITAPDLSTIGSTGLSGDWYAEHLRERAEAPVSSPWRTSFSEIPAAELEAIGVYLSSRVGAGDLISAKATFHSLGCRGCHPVNGVGGDDGPDLSLIGQKDPGRLDFSHVPGERTLSGWFAEHFRAPAKLVPGSQMPYLGLSEEEIDQLNRYLLSLRRTDFPEAFWPRDRIRARYMDQREFSTDGSGLYGTFCAACHGDRGQGMRYPGTPPFPAIANPDFLSLASDEFLRQTISRGRPGRRMPSWGQKEGGLRTEEIETLVSYLRALGGTPAPPPEPEFRWVRGDPETGKSHYTANCGGCHGESGLGAEGSALAGPVFLETASDTFLFETIRRGRRGTTMPGFILATPTNRQLTDDEIASIVSYIRTWETQP